ncbi:hypothetical protein HQ520_14800 [bacterium]|nr:hypothetical protein [bacterium]
MGILKPTLENLAGRLAASNGGRIRLNELVPWLPISLGVLRQHLDEMVDNSVVFCHDTDGIRYYEFAELVDTPRQPMPDDRCLYCDVELRENEIGSLCAGCGNRVKHELSVLAEMTAWPAEAVWQHELIYITSTASGPVRIADVARRSRMTLSQVKQRLQDLARMGCARQILDGEQGGMRYEFPNLRYPRRAYQRNDRFIRLHPSSCKDEWEVKVIKGLVAVIVVLAMVFLLAFAGIPRPLLALGGVIGLVTSLWVILRYRRDVEPERMGEG